MAKNLNSKKDIRLISLGTGEKEFKSIDPDSANVISFMSLSSEFMMNMDSYTAHY
jgi:hypothetical protein